MPHAGGIAGTGNASRPLAGCAPELSSVTVVHTFARPLQLAPPAPYMRGERGSCLQKMRTQVRKALNMRSKISSELREIVWLASVVGGLSVVGVSLALVAAFAVERLSTIPHI